MGLDSPFIEEHRKESAAHYQLAEDATWEQITMVERKDELAGFPEGRGPVWYDIVAALPEVNHLTDYLGLPESATREEIDNAVRKHAASRQGLPESATWEEISTETDAKERKATALRLGLLEDATWEEIMVVWDPQDVQKS